MKKECWSRTRKNKKKKKYKKKKKKKKTKTIKLKLKKVREKQKKYFFCIYILYMEIQDDFDSKKVAKKEYSILKNFIKFPKHNSWRIIEKFYFNRLFTLVSDIYYGLWVAC